MPRQNQSRKIALGGIFSGLAVTVMMLGGVMPLATYLAPCIAGCFIVPVAVEYGLRTGALLYVAIGLLALFTVADLEMSLIFVFFLGYYPLAKAKLDRIRNRIVQWVAKFALFNCAIVALYSILLFIFPMQALVDEFAGEDALFVPILYALGNVTFLIYDRALSRVLAVYLIRFRPRLMK